MGAVVHTNRATHHTPLGARGIRQRHPAVLSNKPLRAFGLHQCGALRPQAFLLGLGKNDNLLCGNLVAADASRVLRLRGLLFACQTGRPALLRSLAGSRKVPRGIRDPYRGPQKRVVQVFIPYRLSLGSLTGDDARRSQVEDWVVGIIDIHK